jgi:hypothetical protein
MIKEVLTQAPEYLPLITAAAGMLGLALNRRQRADILSRDDYTSQMRHYSEEKGWHTGGYCEDGGLDCDNLQVHHIQPQGTFENYHDPEKDSPNNLITLFECEHSGRCPDLKIKKGLFK